MSADTTAEAGQHTVPDPTRRRGPVQILVILLLIAIPLGYGAIAAEQSRANDGDKHARVRAGIVPGAPSSALRRIYQVPIPYNAGSVGYYESNAWHSSSLYVKFTTSSGGLDTFLAQLGTSSSALRAGEVAATPAQAALVRWHFSRERNWAGVVLPTSGTAPAHRITVDLDNPDRPAVYVVATTTFH